VESEVEVLQAALLGVGGYHQVASVVVALHQSVVDVAFKLEEGVVALNRTPLRRPTKGVVMELPRPVGRLKALLKFPVGRSSPHRLLLLQRPLRIMGKSGRGRIKPREIAQSVLKGTSPTSVRCFEG
jgi:hypothetical protein